MAAKNVVFITQARTGSTRLPGKVMKIVEGQTVLYWFLKRALKCKTPAVVCVATTDSPADDALVSHVKKEFPQVHVTRGSEEDVLSRYHKAAQETQADIIIRVTSDCPFFDYNLVDRCVEVMKEKGADGVRTVRSDFPLGLDVEVFSFEALRIAHENATDPFEREHVGPYVFQTHLEQFNIQWVGGEGEEWPHCRLTVDYVEDLKFMEKMFSDLGQAASSKEYRSYLWSHAEVMAINGMHAH